MYLPGMAYGWISCPETLIAIAEMNVQTDQNKYVFNFITTNFVTRAEASCSGLGVTLSSIDAKRVSPRFHRIFSAFS